MRAILTTTILCLLLSACSDSEEDETIQIKITSTSDSYIAYKSVDQWNEIQGEQDISFTTKRGKLEYLVYCEGIDSVYYTLKNIDSPEELNSDCASKQRTIAIENFIADTSHIDSNGHLITDTSNIVTTLFAAPTSPESNEYEVKINSIHWNNKSEGLWFNDAVSLSSDTANIDFSDPTKTSSFTSSGVLDEIYPDTINTSKINLKTAYFSYSLPNISMGFFLNEQDDGYIYYPKIIIDTNTYTPQSLNPQWEITDVTFGTTRISYSTNTNALYPFNSIPFPPRLPTYSVNEDNFIIAVESTYNNGISGSNEEYLDAKVLFSTSENETMWKIRQFEGVQSNLLTIPSKNELPNLPDSIITLKDAGYEYSHASITYTHSIFINDDDQVFIYHTTPDVTNIP